MIFVSPLQANVSTQTKLLLPGLETARLPNPWWQKQVQHDVQTPNCRTPPQPVEQDARSDVRFPKLQLAPI